MRNLPNPLLFAGALLHPIGAQAQGIGDRAYYWDGPWSWGHMIFGPLMMIVFWGGVILLIVLVLRWLGAGSGHGTPPHPPAGSRALEILRERFARGEIDKAEFEERRRLLGE